MHAFLFEENVRGKGIGRVGSTARLSLSDVITQRNGCRLVYHSGLSLTARNDMKLASCVAVNPCVASCVASCVAFLTAWSCRRLSSSPSSRLGCGTRSTQQSSCKKRTRTTMRDAMRSTQAPPNTIQYQQSSTNNQVPWRKALTPLRRL